MSVLREQFPILKTSTYLASHSLGAVPAATEQALCAYYQDWATHGILAWDHVWWNKVQEFSRSMEEILGAPVNTVVPMENATRAMAAVASCFDWRLAKNEIVITDLEFTTAYPFWKGIEEQGAKIRVVESEDGITVPAEKVAAAISSKTKLIYTSHVYFRSGAIQNLKVISETARRSSAFVFGDGYQAVGTAPVNVQDLGVDFYCGGAHKWLCGGAGAGYLYVKKELLEVLEPRFSGWFGLENPFSYEKKNTKLSPGITKFLAGTPSIPALYAAEQGLKILREQLAKNGIQKLRAHVQSLSDALQAFVQARGYKLRSPQRFEDRSGMLCFDFPGAQELSEQLIAKKIITDYRPDCGMRASFHFYSDRSDLERFLSAIL